VSMFQKTPCISFTLINQGAPAQVREIDMAVHVNSCESVLSHMQTCTYNMRLCNDTVYCKILRIVNYVRRPEGGLGSLFYFQ
jgi:hypothetical protein